MATLKIENDRGLGWQTRCEGEIASATPIEEIRDTARRAALNGPARAVLDGVVVFECGKMTKRQFDALYGI